MLYPRAMGEAFGALPEPLQVFHAVDDVVSYRGEVEVSHGSALGRAVAGAGGMPVRAGQMPFGFRAICDGDAEIWERDFDGHITRSRQWLEAPGVIVEQVGSSRFRMMPQVRGERLHIPISGATGFGIPMPGAVLRSCEGVEHVTEDGKIAFDVHARVFLVGLIIRYTGWLAPEA